MDGQTTDPASQGNPAEPQGAGSGAQPANLIDAMGGLDGGKPGGEPANPAGDGGDNPNGQRTDGADAPAWTKQLTKEQQADAEFLKGISKFGTVGDLAKSYSELESKIGRSLVLPADGAGDEEKNAFYEKLGRPKNADGYSIEGEENKAFREMAFSANLTDAQATGIFESLKKTGLDAIESRRSELLREAKETDEALKAEYGEKYQEALSTLKRGIDTFGGQGMGKILADAGIMFNKQVAKMFIRLGEIASEGGSSVKGNGAKNPYTSTDDGGSFSFKDL